MSDSDSWADIPWVNVEHDPPPKSNKKKDKKPKDLNKSGRIPTAYMIRREENGTEWHSIIDILRPNSPPVEWPVYPDRPLENDFPNGLQLDQYSDLDDDPVTVLRKLGIPDEDIKLPKPRKKKTRKKYSDPKPEQQTEGEPDCSAGTLAPEEPYFSASRLAPEVPDCSTCPSAPQGADCSTCTLEPEVPELINIDNLTQNHFDELNSVQLFPTTGYGGALTDRLDDDDYYPHDSKSNGLGNDPESDFGYVYSKSPGNFGGKESKTAEWEFQEDSSELSPDEYNTDRQKMWKELQDL